VLETGEVQRVGSLQLRTVDVRIVAATNRHLPQEVEVGRTPIERHRPCMDAA